MAEEAAVENLPVNRFYCHMCNRSINRELPDYTCPTCNSGFIEVLENSSDQIEEIEQDLEVEVHPPVEEIINEILMQDFEIERGVRNDERRGGRRRSVRVARSRQLAPVETLIQDFIMNLSSVGWGGSNNHHIGVGTARATSPGGHLLLMANPGDYAWGREGLDAIVTQLLNQMDTTGPPPLAKDKISQIPKVVITKEQQETNIQCSVCWEDFKAEEEVRKLPCEHLYHEHCIIPWLELHGTCPICRKTLTEDGRVEDAESASNSVGSLAASLFRYSPSESSNSRTSSSSSSSSSGSGTSSSSGSIMSTNSTNSSRPDFNMDIDFD